MLMPRSMVGGFGHPLGGGRGNATDRVSAFPVLSHARVDSSTRAKRRAFLERCDGIDQCVGRFPIQ